MSRQMLDGLSQPLGPDSWPTTVDETVQDLLRQIPATELASIKSTKQSDLISFHLGLGRAIRNRYGLLRGNDKLIVSACGWRNHPDSASMKIIEALWQSLQ